MILAEPVAAKPEDKKEAPEEAKEPEEDVKEAEENGELEVSEKPVEPEKSEEAKEPEAPLPHQDLLVSEETTGSKTASQSQAAFEIPAAVILPSESVDEALSAGRAKAKEAADLVDAASAAAPVD